MCTDAPIPTPLLCICTPILCTDNLILCTDTPLMCTVTPTKWKENKQKKIERGREIKFGKKSSSQKVSRVIKKFQG